MALLRSLKDNFTSQHRCPVGLMDIKEFVLPIKRAFQILGGLRIGGQGRGDNSIQFINIGRVGEKSF